MAESRKGGVRFHSGDWGDLLSTRPEGRKVFTRRVADAGLDGIDIITPSKAQVGGADFFNPYD